MIAAIVFLAVLLVLGAAIWLSRRRNPVAVAQPQEAENAAPHAAAASAPLDLALVSAANNAATERLWKLAFSAPAAAPVEDSAEQQMRLAIFNVLRADSLDPKYFPRRPTLMTQLMHAFDDERTASDQISRMITRDPVLTADVLRLANSTMYRTTPEPIGTIQRAVIVCGSEVLRRLTATALLLPVFRASRTNFPRFPRLLWERTERAARAAEIYVASSPPQDRFEAQMAALMSALGPLVVFGVALDIYARSPQTPPNPETFTSLLRDLSTTMAQRVAGQWETAPRVVAALQRSATESLTTALCVGELMATLSVLQTQNVISAEQLHATAAGVGLPDARIYEIAQRLAAQE
jgi:hypothetical protein